MHPDDTYLPDVLPDVLPGLTEGRCCHYVDDQGLHLAALIIGHDASQSYTRADLAVFTNARDTYGQKHFGLQFVQMVEYSDNKEPRTWHWIERA